MAIVRTYNYKMGFKVNNVAIPDPSGFTGKVSDLDTEGGRDATGTLHRHRVATKFPLKLQYNAISYEMMGQSGPDHDKTFLFRVLINGAPVGEGSGRSKKEAEQMAAREALERMAP